MFISKLIEDVIVRTDEYVEVAYAGGIVYGEILPSAPEGEMLDILPVGSDTSLHINKSSLVSIRIIPKEELPSPSEGGPLLPPQASSRRPTK